MKKNIHFLSWMQAMIGGIMFFCGILIAVLGKPEIGGVFWAAAYCLFFSAYHFRLAENKKEKAEKSKDGQKTV